MYIFSYTFEVGKLLNWVTIHIVPLAEISLSPNF